jgi:hypothetical protein
MRKLHILALLLMAPLVFAQDNEPNCRDLSVVRDCTVRQLNRQLGHPNVSLEEVSAIRIALTRNVAVPAPVARAVAAAPSVTAQVTDRLKTENVATTAPQSSDARIHASRQNFNIPLSVAINSVDRNADKQSIVVRFNALSAGFFSAGITGTITQPAVYAALEEQIGPEESREAVLKKLGKSLEETDDVGVSIHLAPETPECTPNRIQRGACHGLDPRAYDEVLNTMFRALLGPDPGTSEATDAVASAVADFVRAHATDEVGDLSPRERDELFDLLMLLKMSDRADTARETRQRANTQVEKLAKLLEQQPQWSLTLNANRRDRLVGPNAQSADLEYRRGRQNLNTVWSDCVDEADPSACITNVLKNLRTDTFVFGLSAKQTDSYQLDALPPSTLGDTQTFTALANDRLRTYLARIQYGRDLMGARVNDVPIRFDVQATWEQVTGATKESRPYDTRFVVATTLSVPLSDAITIPVTLSYANHEEFLKNQQKKLGIHFGLTYRIPFKKAE